MNKNFYKNFFSICVVLIFQNVITLSVNLADNVMLGGYSETALSGVAAVNQIQFVFQQIINALGDGLVIIGSQYWGKKQTEPMKKIAVNAMHIALIVGAVLMLLVSFFPSQAVGIFTRDATIISEGVRYIGVIRFTYLFFVLTQVLLATLRSVGEVKVAFWLSVQTLVVNCCINYVLIYGKFGMPELGVMGAAIGTLTARILETAVLLVYIAKTEKDLCLKVKDYLRIDKSLLNDYIRVTTPILLIAGLWGLNTAMQTVILGHMNSAAIAANSAASTLFLLVKSTAVGAASATSIIIGKGIGEGALDRVKAESKALQKLFVMMGICGGIILYFLRIPILSLYDMSASTKEMADTFLKILSVVFVGMSYQMPTNIGIIRGGGDSKFVMKMDIISIWCIVIPISLVMAFIVEAPATVVVCCLNMDQLFKCVPAFIKANYGKWIHKLTRDV